MKIVISPIFGAKSEICSKLTKFVSFERGRVAHRIAKKTTSRGLQDDPKLSIGSLECAE